MNSNGMALEELKSIAVRTMFADPRDRKTLAGIARDIDGIRGRLTLNYGELGALLEASATALRAVSNRRPQGNAEEVVYAAATTIRTAEEFVSETVDDAGLASLLQAGRTLRAFLGSAFPHSPGDSARDEVAPATGPDQPAPGEGPRQRMGAMT